LKIGWSHVVIDFVDKEKNFEEDTLMELGASGEI